MTRTGIRTAIQLVAVIATILLLVYFRHQPIAFLCIGLGFIAFEKVLSLITAPHS